MRDHISDKTMMKDSEKGLGDGVFLQMFEDYAKTLEFVVKTRIKGFEVLYYGKTEEIPMELVEEFDTSDIDSQYSIIYEDYSRL